MKIADGNRQVCGTKINMGNENRQWKLSKDENYHRIGIINENRQGIGIVKEYQLPTKTTKGIGIIKKYQLSK